MAAGVTVRIEDRDGKVIKEGKMDDEGEYTFKTPECSFTVIMDAGPGHIVKEKSGNIIE
jgi:hypothetical protein